MCIHCIIIKCKTTRTVKGFGCKGFCTLHGQCPPWKCHAYTQRSHSPAVSGMHREGDYPPAVHDRGTGVTIHSQGVQYLDLFRYNRTLEALHFWAPPTLGWDFDSFIQSDAALLAFVRTLEECPRRHCLTLYFHPVMTLKFWMFGSRSASACHRIRYF